MNDVRGDFLGPPHGTTPIAVIIIQNPPSDMSDLKAFLIHVHQYHGNELRFRESIDFMGSLESDFDLRRIKDWTSLLSCT